MIKSVTYLGEGKRSYEVTEESDVQNLETNLAEGSSVRVVGKIESEYELQGGTWVKTAGGSADNHFVVTLTPTAQDFSGVMDKPVGEIISAFDAGKNVIARIVSGDLIVIAPILFERANTSEGGKKAVEGLFIYSQLRLLISFYAYDDMQNNYSTTIYQLTPMGS